MKTGVTGMIAYQREMDNIAQNIANVNTAGYKPGSTRFQELVSTEMDVNNAGDNLVGHGVRQIGQQIRFTQGAMIQSGGTLDYAIAGDGFFAVDHGGVTEYTRNGAFRLSEGDGASRLIDADGNAVLDGSGQPISAAKDSETGEVDYAKLKETIGVFLFDNPYGLERTSSGRFVPGTLSGDPKTTDANGADAPYQVLSGCLEASAVDIGGEMVGVIEAQRAFQLNAKIVQTADQIEEIVNNLR